MVSGKLETAAKKGWGKSGFRISSDLAKCVAAE
jgi:hypothetical protein